MPEMEVVRKEPHHGWIEVITGSMFSGKSEELIRRLRRAQIARQKVQIFKPLIDNRFSDDHIVSHSDMRIASSNVRNSDELVRRSTTTPRSSGSTKGNSSTPNLPAACNTLADSGKRVIVAGLDQDYLGRPFEPMPQLLAIAEYITKTLAICVVCGDPANHTQRLVASSDRVLVGATGSTRRAAATVSIRTSPRNEQADAGARPGLVRRPRFVVALPAYSSLLGLGFLAPMRSWRSTIFASGRRRGALLTWRVRSRRIHFGARLGVALGLLVFASCVPPTGRRSARR